MPSAQEGHETAEVCATVMVTETETRALRERGLAGISERKDEGSTGITRSQRSRKG